jgi:hypothetical protein
MRATTNLLLTPPCARRGNGYSRSPVAAPPDHTSWTFQSPGEAVCERARFLSRVSHWVRTRRQSARGRPAEGVLLFPEGLVVG